MKGIIIILSIFSFTSCGIVDEEEYISNSWASVDKVEILENSAGIIKFDITLGVPNPCHIFQKRDIEAVSDTLYIKYYSKSKADAVCPAVLSSIQINDSFELNPKQYYYFKFWQIGGTTLDTLVYLK